MRPQCLAPRGAAGVTLAPGVPHTCQHTKLSVILPAAFPLEPCCGISRCGHVLHHKKQHHYRARRAEAERYQRVNARTGKWSGIRRFQWQISDSGGSSEGASANLR
jgi:hypothetical protein